jgi:nucleoside-diphosphate-sugar epimerase
LSWKRLRANIISDLLGGRPLMNTFLVTGAPVLPALTWPKSWCGGEKVQVLDNFLTGKRRNVEPFETFIDLVEGDIRDLETCRRALHGVDFVLHQAALPSVPRSIEEPLLAHDINVTGTLNLLVASVEAKVRRFIFASSSSVYGDDPVIPKKEGSEGAQLSPYAVHKFTGEKYCRVFHDLYGLETISLRYFNVFGPRQDPLSQYAAVIPLFITKIMKGDRPQIFGDGEQSRDFTYVSNVVEANLRAVEAPDEAVGEVFNVACGTGQRSILSPEICEHLVLVRPYTDPRPGDILHSFADISKARECLGLSSWS